MVLYEGMVLAEDKFTVSFYKATVFHQVGAHCITQNCPELLDPV